MQLLKGLFSSKKATVALIGIVVEVMVAVGVVKLDSPEAKAQLMEAIVYIVGAFTVGQGIADHGKEAEKAKAANATTGTTGGQP